MRMFERTATVLLVLLLSGCVHPVTVRELKESLTRESLAQEAFLRAERSIREVIPGQPVSQSPLKWPVHEVKQGSRVVGLVAVADGWASELSGGVFGAHSGIGGIVAHKDGRLHGQHVYGYLADASIFIPRYVVRTSANVISEDDFRSQRSRSTADVGWAYVPGDKDRKIFFSEVRVAHVRPLEGPVQISESARPAGSNPVSRAGIEKIAAELYSRERFESIAEKLKNVPLGSDAFSVVSWLEGIYVGNYGGTAMVLFMKGYLNYQAEFIISKMTDHGIYEVWPFGYVENGKEVPVLALVFKNGVVESVIPYKSKEHVLTVLQ